MNRLELKIPPPLLVILFSGLMWLASKTLPVIELPKTLRCSFLFTSCIIATLITLAGVIAFKRQKTTVNPTKPGNTSSLVTSGVYQITRNPMYLGLAIFLIGCAFFLGSVYALGFVPCFVLYMQRFQIMPEEKALETIFGDTFLDYKQQVRRWI